MTESTSSLTAKIDALSDARDAQTALRLAWEAGRDRILEQVKEELTALDAEYTPQLATVQETATTLEAEVRAEVLRVGISCKGTRLHVIWVKGRVSWDTKALDGYAAAHPEMLQFRKEGEPSISMRNI
jgi:hypothetical protein